VLKSRLPLLTLHCQSSFCDYGLPQIYGLQEENNLGTASNLRIAPDTVYDHIDAIDLSDVTLATYEL
jgi:hypothetical protein